MISLSVSRTTAYIMYEVSYNGKMSYYFSCRLHPEGCWAGPASDSYSIVFMSLPVLYLW